VKVRSKTRRRQKQGGIALLISIFILLLIGVMAIALVVSSGTESALAGNYRSSTSVYYAAVAGLEEVRSRLKPNNPNSFNIIAPGFLPAPGIPLAVCSPVYLINSLAGEAITPWDQASAYPDKEFSQEYGAVCPPVPSPSPTERSVWNRGPLNGLPFPGPLYKWVRINGVTEQSLNLDTSPYDGRIDPNLVYYDGNTASLNDTNTGVQVYEITALAVLPNGSQKLLQYLIAAVPVNVPTFPPTFPAALTLLGGPGNSAVFAAPASNANFSVKGLDQDTVGACVPGPAIPAVAVLTNPDQGNVINGIPAAYRTNYKGSSNGPDVQNVSASLPANLQTPAGLEALVQSITQNADVVINGNTTGSNLPAAMYSPSPNPMTIVVNGDLDLASWHQTGYGLLLVRGNLNYDPDASWRGIVLVIGKGTVTGSLGGGGEFDGTFVVANTLGGGNNLGSPSMTFGSNMGGNGIRYSSCWVQRSQPIANFKILSFDEISQ
jgi:hypothetical protein